MSAPDRMMTKTAVLAGRTVLIVDDYPEVLAWAGRAFTRAGWTVLTAPDGRHAEKMWHDTRRAGDRIALLVTDLEMPGLDGVSLAKLLREDDAELRVIAISGLHTQQTVAQLPEHTRFFLKPIRAAELLQAATEMCGQ